MEDYVAEAFAETRASWSAEVCSSPERKKARQCEEEGGVGEQLWEVMEQIRILTPLAASFEEMRSEIMAIKTEKLEWTRGLKDSAVELEDLVLETKREKSLQISAASVVKLRDEKCDVYALNVVTAAVHSVNIESLAQSESTDWMARCGWSIRAGLAVLTRDAPPEGRCQKWGCRGNWKEEQASCEQAASDDEA